MRPASVSEDCRSNSGPALPRTRKARGVVGPVREDPQQTKESFLSLDLVDDHEPLQRFERELGIGKRRLVRRVFEVEEGDRLPLAADQGAGERRLSDLPRADETDDRKHPQQVPDGCFVSDTREHGWQYTGKSKEEFLIFLFLASRRNRGNDRLRGRRPTLAGALLPLDAIAHDPVSVDGAAGVYGVVLWDADKLLTRLTLGEDSRVRFMEVDFTDGCVREPRRQRIADELAAFGNTLGGALIFSVSDAGEVRPMTWEIMDALEAYVGEICADSIDPPLGFTTQRPALPDDASALVVEVERSPLVHRSPGGYLWPSGKLRARAVSGSATSACFSSGGAPACSARTRKSSPVRGSTRWTRRSSIGSSAPAQGRPTRRSSPSSGWCGEDDSGVLRATVAGVLLCTEHPGEFISSAAIEAVCYSGTVLGRASQHDAAMITGPLDRQIRDAVNFAKRNTRVAARKSPGRVDVPQYNPRAVFEAVVNAAVHRDYSIANAKIRLFLFDDRLELYSPGALPNTLPIDAMRQRQATRNETLASLLRMLEVGDVHGAGDRQYYLEQRGEGVPIIYEETRALMGSEPVYELIDAAELRLTMPSARPPVSGIQGEVSVTAEGRPLAGATVLALYSNKTWMMEGTDSFGRVRFGFHSEVPITVFCAAPAHRAHVERRWRPPTPLSVELGALANGGSMVIPERIGHLPGLAGRLNPILDKLHRMYLYATNVAIDEGLAQPVHFKLGGAMRLTDVHGAEWLVRFVEMLGNSSVLEYEPPPSRVR